jgi:hypothetical protein
VLEMADSTGKLQFSGEQIGALCSCRFVDICKYGGVKSAFNLFSDSRSSETQRGATIS